MSGLEVEGLGRRFGTRVAVERLSFQISPGEVFGLLGPNGAGKTTTVRMLTALLQPTEGDARVCGLSVRTEGDRIRRRVGLLTEQPGLYDRLTARENLRFFIQLFELEERSAWARAEAWLQRFGLGGRADEPVGGFSKGMRQKLALVRALVHDPEVLFLDEPTSGLDPESARTVRDALAELASEKKTLVLCSHNLAEVERLCQRVAVVKTRLLALAPVRELRRKGLALDVHVEGDAQRFLPALQALPFSPEALSEGGRIRVLLSEDEQSPEVLACLVGAGARIYQAVRVERPLEEVYLELVRGEREAA